MLSLQSSLWLAKRKAISMNLDLELATIGSGLFPSEGLYLTRNSKSGMTFSKLWTAVILDLPPSTFWGGHLMPMAFTIPNIFVICWLWEGPCLLLFVLSVLMRRNRSTTSLFVKDHLKSLAKLACCAGYPSCLA